MVVSNISGGIIVSWGAEHRDGKGNLICRHISVEQPGIPTCTNFHCLWEYLKASILYTLILAYHQKRTVYAELNRHKNIPERYRTGEPSPQTFGRAFRAYIKLAIRR